MKESGFHYEDSERDPWEYYELGLITAGQARARAARIAMSHTVSSDTETTAPPAAPEPSAAPAKRQPRKKWGGRAPSNRELMMADKNLDEAHWPNGKQGAPPRVPTEAAASEEPLVYSPETTAAIEAFLARTKPREEPGDIDPEAYL